MTKNSDYDHSNNTTKLNQKLRKQIAYEVMNKLFSNKIDEHNKSFKEFVTYIVDKNFEGYYKLKKKLPKEDVKWLVGTTTRNVDAWGDNVVLRTKCDFKSKSFDLYSINIARDYHSITVPKTESYWFNLDKLDYVINNPDVNVKLADFVSDTEKLIKEFNETYKEFYPLLIQCKSVKELVAIMPNITELCNLPTPSTPIGSSLMVQANSMNALLDSYVQSKNK